MLRLITTNEKIGKLKKCCMVNCFGFSKISSNMSIFSQKLIKMEALIAAFRDKQKQQTMSFKLRIIVK